MRALNQGQSNTIENSRGQGLDECALDQYLIMRATEQIIDPILHVRTVDS